MIQFEDTNDGLAGCSRYTHFDISKSIAQGSATRHSGFRHMSHWRPASRTHFIPLPTKTSSLGVEERGASLSIDPVSSCAAQGGGRSRRGWLNHIQATYSASLTCGRLDIALTLWRLGACI